MERWKRAWLGAALVLAPAMIIAGCDDNDDEPSGAATTAADGATSLASERTSVPTTQGGTNDRNDQEEVRFDMHALNNSGVTGVVTVSAQGDATKVVVELAGSDVPRPLAIYDDDCDDIDDDDDDGDDLMFELNESVDGRSETVVQERMTELLDDDHALVARESAANPNTYVACGEFPDD